MRDNDTDFGVVLVPNQVQMRIDKPGTEFGRVSTILWFYCYKPCWRMDKLLYILKLAVNDINQIEYRKIPHRDTNMAKLEDFRFSHIHTQDSSSYSNRID